MTLGFSYELADTQPYLHPSLMDLSMRHVETGARHLGSSYQSNSVRGPIVILISFYRCSFISVVALLHYNPYQTILVLLLCFIITRTKLYWCCCEAFIYSIIPAPTMLLIFYFIIRFLGLLSSKLTSPFICFKPCFICLQSCQSSY